MDFKKLFKNNDAVSPVIGVILMVAITVILAAAIGSSVFGRGPTPSAPQANLEIKANSTAVTTGNGSVKIEHLGGDTIHFGNPDITRVTASLNGAQSVDIDGTSLGNMSVGDSKILSLANSTGNVLGSGRPVSSDIVNIKIIDVKTSQLISNKDVRF
jgi:archaeal type IV pilus assembly protein PilA